MSTSLYFAAGTSTELLKTTLLPWDWEANPLNILIAFPHIRQWQKVDPGWPVKATMLDSGAFSAWKSGVEIDFDKLCEEAAKPYWNEAVGMDVIGDPVASLANCLEMKARGLTVMPVFHFAEPFEILQEYKTHFDRIGLSCRFGESWAETNRWLDQCFARAYPAKFHSFGLVKESVLLRYPFLTADTASWHVSIRFGKSMSAPDIRLQKASEVPESMRYTKGGVYDLRSELLWYLDMEKRIQDRWAIELAWTKEENAASLVS